jgi:hypothetical protein
MTETCRNKRLREQRKMAWSDADATTRYWRAKMEWDSARTFAQSRGLAVMQNDKHDYRDDRDYSVQQWRNSIAAQMLVPAPDMNAVTWKRGQLRDTQWKWTSTTDKQVERALAADVEWLEQHPTRKSLLAAAQAKARKAAKSSKPEGGQ